MTKPDQARAKWVAAAHSRLDRLLYGFSTFALPLFIGLISVVALLSWRTQYPVPDSRPLPMRVMPQSNETLTPALALARLDAQTPVPHFDTQLSELPFWFSLSVPESSDGQHRSVELPSRHAMQTTCWDSDSMQPLGSATRQAAQGSLTPIKAGFALDLDGRASELRVLCRASFIGGMKRRQ